MMGLFTHQAIAVRERFGRAGWVRRRRIWCLLILMKARFRRSAFQGVPFRTMPFYSGDPWFLPLAMGLYAIQDKFKTTSK